MNDLQDILNFENMGFGMFIHFGLYSILGMGEWVNSSEVVISRENYKRLIDKFDVPKNYFRKLVKLAKESGCKYIIITTRHHDGFSLYDTKGLSTFDVMHSKAKRDLIKEFVDECNKENILPFFYHTGLDWNHPLYNENRKEYLKYLQKSIEILSTNYGKIGGFWFDGFWEETDWEIDKLFKIIRTNQPQAIITLNKEFDKTNPIYDEIGSITFERKLPNNNDNEKHYGHEMVQVINDHWGYSKNDINNKSVKTLLENMAECRKYRSNYVLNIGPTLKGASPIENATFKSIGKWISVYKESFYNTIPTECIVNREKDFVLENEKYYYVYLYDICSNGDLNVVLRNSPNEHIEIKNINKIKEAKLLDNNTKLSYEYKNETLIFECPPFEYSYNYGVRVIRLKK